MIAVIIVVIMLIKKMDIKITLFAMGIVLMYIANRHGKSKSQSRNLNQTGLTVLDPLKAVIDQFKSTLPAAGFIILILGGYSAYMTSIGANEVTVHTLTKPIKKIKSVYILVPLVFLIGNVLSRCNSKCFQPCHHPACDTVSCFASGRYVSVDRSGSHCHYRNGYADSSWR